MSGDVTNILAQHADAIRILGKRIIADVIEVGRRLTEAKKIAGHGNWLPWLEREFGWHKEDTAAHYMRVYDLSLQIPNDVRNFDITLSGLYLLAAPSTSPEVRTEIIERAKAGEKVTVHDVKKAKKAVDTKDNDPRFFHNEKGQLRRHPNPPHITPAVLEDARENTSSVFQKATHTTKSEPPEPTAKPKIAPALSLPSGYELCCQVERAIATLCNLPNAQAMLGHFDDLDKKDSFLGDIVASRLNAATDWLNDFRQAWDNSMQVATPPIAPTDGALVWRQSLISVTLDDGITYHQQIADIAEAVWYRITVETKPNSLTFSHYVVSLNDKVIGRARALDAAKKIAQDHADQTQEINAPSTATTSTGDDLDIPGFLDRRVKTEEAA